MEEKNTIPDIEKLTPIFNSRTDTAEERIIDLKDEWKFARMNFGWRGG